MFYLQLIAIGESITDISLGMSQDIASGNGISAIGIGVDLVFCLIPGISTAQSEVGEEIVETVVEKTARNEVAEEAVETATGRGARETAEEVIKGGKATKVLSISEAEEYTFNAIKGPNNADALYLHIDNGNIQIIDNSLMHAAGDCSIIDFGTCEY